MKRKKSNLIMNLALICALTIIAVLPLPVAEAANLGISKTNVSLETGKDTTITISAVTHTGRLDIISSNVNVATVSESSLWVENNSKTITISAKAPGTAKITIRGELFDADTDEEKEFLQTVNVTVKGSNSNSNNNENKTNTTTGGNINGVTSGTVTGNTGASNSGTQSNSSSSGSGSNKNSSGSLSSNKQNSLSDTSSNTTRPSQNNTTVRDQTESTTQIEEVEEINKVEEVLEEDVKIEEDLKEEILNSVEIENIETSNSINPNGKIILIAIIGGIAIAMIFIGIGVSKNIIKK